VRLKTYGYLPGCRTLPLLLGQRHIELFLTRVHQVLDLRAEIGELRCTLGNASPSVQQLKSDVDELSKALDMVVAKKTDFRRLISTGQMKSHISNSAGHAADNGACRKTFRAY